MKNPSLLLILVVVALAACKTQKIAPKPVAVAEEKTTPAVVGAPTPAPKAFIGKPMAVASKEEHFSVASGEIADYGSNKFFVIMGSFSVLENAKRLKETLTSENFHPVILMNDSGMYRVCGNSYAEETAARARIAEVRSSFPKYSDIWLLIRKQ
ncbi:MAG: SPOR domain-containing protein [Prolixibacteraceae bacterium]|nr:SPOR domain-containing protein [Prolixibacteraceae bacterium]